MLCIHADAVRCCRVPNQGFACDSSIAQWLHAVVCLEKHSGPMLGTWLPSWSCALREADFLLLVAVL